MREAIQREKRIKRWRREWKLALIEAQNPQWRGSLNLMGRCRGFSGREIAASRAQGWVPDLRALQALRPG